MCERAVRVWDYTTTYVFKAATNKQVRMLSAHKLSMPLPCPRHPLMCLFTMFVEKRSCRRVCLYSWLSTSWGEKPRRTSTTSRTPGWVTT